MDPPIHSQRLAGPVFGEAGITENRPPTYNRTICIAFEICALPGNYYYYFAGKKTSIGSTTPGHVLHACMTCRHRKYPWLVIIGYR